MDTTFAKHFGASEMEGILKVLGKSEHACARLQSALEPEDRTAGIEMLRRGELIGSTGAFIHDFFLDEIENEARDVWSGTLFNPEDEHNPDTSYPVGIREYCGVYFVWALEHDNAGYFLSRDEALFYVMGNWSHVREDT